MISSLHESFGVPRLMEAPSSPLRFSQLDVEAPRSATRLPPPPPGVRSMETVDYDSMSTRFEPDLRGTFTGLRRLAGVETEVTAASSPDEHTSTSLSVDENLSIILGRRRYRQSRSDPPGAEDRDLQPFAPSAAAPTSAPVRALGDA